MTHRIVQLLKNIRCMVMEDHIYDVSEMGDELSMNKDRVKRYIREDIKGICLEKVDAYEGAVKKKIVRNIRDEVLVHGNFSAKKIAEKFKMTEQQVLIIVEILGGDVEKKVMKEELEKQLKAKIGELVLEQRIHNPKVLAKRYGTTVERVLQIAKENGNPEVLKWLEGWLTVDKLLNMELKLD